MEKLLKKLLYKRRSEQVAEFYNSWSEKFLTITDTFQGFRTENIEDIHRHTISAASLTDMDVILDAGCGVGGPAFFFARSLKAEIHALTNAKEQVRIINERKEREGTKNLSAVLGDYHHLEERFQPEFFTRILFLESLGHSYNPNQALSQASKMLKPGGILYIRDLFKIQSDSPQTAREIDRLAKRANKAFVYNHLPAKLFTDMLSSMGFNIEYSRIPDVVFKSIDDEFEKKLGIPSTRGPISFAEPVEIRAMKKKNA